MTDALRKAAQAVLDRWDSPKWEWISHRPTADLMTALRTALAAAQPPAAMPVPPTVLPDGSAFFTASLPLPKDHWLYAPRCAEWDTERDTTTDTPYPILNNSHRHAVIAAIRYAVRGATMCGQEMDFDPDALAMNAVYALCGPATGRVLPADGAQAQSVPATGAQPDMRAELEAYSWRTRGRPLRLSDPEMAPAMARLKERIATDPAFALGLMASAGICNEDGTLAEQYGGAPTAPTGSAG